jgi:hypothetical protein
MRCGETVFQMGGLNMPVANDPTAEEQDDAARVTLANDRVRKQIDDALELANYAVKAGARSENANDDVQHPLEDIATIQTTAAKLGIFNPPQKAAGGNPPQQDPNGGSVTTKEWNDFEYAYYRLATVMSPVTAETLRDTHATSRTAEVVTYPGESPIWPHLRRLRDWLFGYSPAQRFARGLWLVAIAFALFVVWAEWRIFVLGLDADVTSGGDFSPQSKRQFLNSLVPWAYGGLGACAFLLRSAHQYIYERSFDLRRKPEYFNRILLGAISGGAIILFTKYLADEDSTTVQLSAAALGFVAGYSTDFLFNTIQRIVTAIFPKVDMETVEPDAEKPRLADLPKKPGDGARAA